jgi:NAD(P)-dependent dehydrogenase (short-subunit alcohol dehydrogenase family)
MAGGNCHRRLMGLGEADARALAKVHAVTDEPVGAAVAKAIGGEYRFDVTNEAQWIALIADVVSHHGGLHPGDNAASSPGTIETQTYDEYKRQMAVARTAFSDARRAGNCTKRRLHHQRHRLLQTQHSQRHCHCAAKGAVEALSPWRCTV